MGTYMPYEIVNQLNTNIKRLCNGQSSEYKVSLLRELIANTNIELFKIIGIEDSLYVTNIITAASQNEYSSEVLVKFLDVKYINSRIFILDEKIRICTPVEFDQLLMQDYIEVGEVCYIFGDEIYEVSKKDVQFIVAKDIEFEIKDGNYYSFPELLSKWDKR